MATIRLSKNAATKVILYSEEASEQLISNINIMDNNVNSQFEGLQDPAFRRYLEMSEEMQLRLKQVSKKMADISEYCRKVIRWIDNYNEY